MNRSGGRPERAEKRGSGSRSERRSTRRVARRRKRVAKLFVAAVPAVVVMAGVVALLIVLGGRADELTAAAGETTTTSSPSSGQTQAVLVVIEQDGEIPALVLLARRADGGIALGLPGKTLVRTDDGFPTVGDLYLSDKTDTMVTALTADLGVDLAGVAGIGWITLLGILEKSGSPESWPPSLGDDGDGALKAAEAFLTVAELTASSGAAAWERAQISGNVTALRKFVGDVSQEIGAGSWAASALPGTAKEGLDYDVWEPDIAAARQLMEGRSSGADPGDITLEVQNGSGQLNAAEAAGEMLLSLGHKMLPFQNAEGFPDVTETTILAAPDCLEEAEKVRDRLGVGTVLRDDSLLSRHIRVIVGKDFVPSTTS